jgi:amidase
MITWQDYVTWDGVEIAQKIQKGEVSEKEVLETALTLARTINPPLNAIVTWIEPDSPLARDLNSQGPLRGIPTFLKDLDQPLAGVPMTCGSKLLRKSIPERDSEFVRRIKGAGMVILGKTNVPEFGLLAYTEPEIFGPARNPWDLERTPGGSSGGSAVVVASGIVPLASASDGGGSIRIPSGYTGLIGLKVSRGRTPTGPDVGEPWQGFAVNFFLTRTIRDTAVLLDLMAEPETGAPFQIPPPKEPYSRVYQTPPSPLRIAITTKSPLGTAVDPDVERGVRSAGRILEELGHRVEEMDPGISGDMLMDVFLTMYYGEVSATVRTLKETYGATVLKEIEPITATLYAVGESLKAGEFVRKLSFRNELTRRIGSFLERYDLFVTPTVAVLPPRIGELTPKGVLPFAMRFSAYWKLGGLLRRLPFFDTLSRENFRRTPFTQIANIAGIPALSLPFFLPDLHLPIGIQFLAGFGREDLLLQIGHQWEQAHPFFHRFPPPPIRRILEGSSLP